jgi:coiled-coil domain-containing protein 130
MGRYVPPEHEGLTSGNTLHRKRPPGMTAQGQTVRFEMPFPIWCATCPKPTIIGQGVRFNALKSKVGNYFSSPIFAFRMRHPACGGEIEIRTDPKNTAYVVTSGARRRDLGLDEDSLVKSGDALVAQIMTGEERKDLREVAFKNLEKTIEDRAVAEAGKERLEELQSAADQWENPYERNRRLRKAFRVGRKEREREAVHGEEIKGRLGLGEEFELLPGREEDTIRARLVDFGGVQDDGVDGQEKGVDRALVKPLFGGPATGSTADAGKTSSDTSKKTSKVTKKLKSEIAATKMRESLVNEIVGNTRAARDPFLGFGNASSSRSPAPRIPGLKRKRGTEASPGPSAKMETAKADPPSESGISVGLVTYDSD